MHNRTKKLSSKGWASMAPRRGNDRSLMMYNCGRKCFLGSKKRFPICARGTCKISDKGIYAAYVRARQWRHKKIANRSKKLLRKKGYRVA